MNNSLDGTKYSIRPMVSFSSKKCYLALLHGIIYLIVLIVFILLGQKTMINLMTNYIKIKIIVELQRHPKKMIF